MSAAPVRLGLVGCGRLAERGYVPAARIAASVQIVAVSDPARERRALIGGKLGASVHARLSELLAATELDGIVVGAASEQHEEVAAAVAQAGLPALVETPPAPTGAGALRIATLTPASWIGFNRRFDQGRDLARRVPPEGELDVRMVLHYRRARWRPVAGGDDALLDIAPHLVDLALYLTKALPVAVRAQAARERAGLELASARARISIECATDLRHHELVEIHDASGRRVARAERGSRTREAAARVRPQGHPLVRSLAAQLEAYGRALRGGDAGPLATAGEGAAVMRVLDAARRSDAIGGETVAVEGVALRDVGT
ncbi:MAG: Gfo/Idh/MocA family oxidoreductase [Solirubrobacteraceae bacterium]|nr:Gfo/Idh/MocA family oxidoreductase [Solirubrobacteraceae bacterium]